MNLRPAVAMCAVSACVAATVAVWPAAQARTLRTSPGHTQMWEGQPYRPASSEAAVRQVFSVNALPTAGLLRFGTQLKDRTGRGVIGRAAVDSRGRLYAQLLDRQGVTVRTVATGVVVRPGQPIEVVVAAPSAATDRVRVHVGIAGARRGGWQIERASLLSGRSVQQVRGVTYLSRSATNPVRVTLHASSYVDRDVTAQSVRPRPAAPPSSLPTVSATPTPSAAPASIAPPVPTPTISVETPRELPEAGNPLPAQPSASFYSVHPGEVTTQRSASFSYPGALCKVDSRPIVPCSTLTTFDNLDYGPHRVIVATGTGPHEFTWNVRSDVPGQAMPSDQVAGVPAGVSLQTMDGSEDGVADGILKIDGRRHPHLLRLDAKDIRAKVEVVSGNASLTRSVVAPSGQPTPMNGIVSLPYKADPSASLTVTDTTIKWASPLPYNDPASSYVVGLKGKNITAHRVIVENVSDGVNIDGGNFVLRNSLIHNGIRSLRRAGDPEEAHADAIQISHGANAVIAGNKLSGFAMSAVMLTPDLGPISDIQVTNNWLGGGTCVINGNEKKSQIAGIVVRNNVFSAGSQAHGACAADGRPNTFGWLTGVTGVQASGNTTDAGAPAFVRVFPNNYLS